MLGWEIKKLIMNFWNLPVITGVMGLWGVILYFAAENGSNLLNTSATFWHVLGSLAIGFNILIVNTGIFNLDNEEEVKEVILTTRNGKANILLIRMIATICYTICIICLFLFIQILGFLIFNGTVLFTEFMMNCLEEFLYVLMGSVLFSIFTACICMIFNSHTVTVILCGFLFGMTYILRGNLLQKYSFLWFLEKGFFSYLIRVKEILLDPHIVVLTVWYGILMIGIFILTITLQWGRNEI